jgi:hypothetical protein
MNKRRNQEMRLARNVDKNHLKNSDGLHPKERDSSHLCLVGVRVGTGHATARDNSDGEEALVVLKALGAATLPLLLLLSLVDVRGLVADLTSASKRTVDLSYTKVSGENRKKEGNVGLKGEREWLQRDKPKTTKRYIPIVVAEEKGKF